MLEFIKSRRSTRSFKKEMVNKELVDMVVEAGRFAPSGGNSQTCHFLVIKNQDILKNLRTMVCDCFSKMDIKEGMYKSIVNSIKASKNGKYDFHYSSPMTQEV